MTYTSGDAPEGYERLPHTMKGMICHDKAGTYYAVIIHPEGRREVHPFPCIEEARIYMMERFEAEDQWMRNERN